MNEITAKEKEIALALKLYLLGVITKDEYRKISR